MIRYTRKTREILTFIDQYGFLTSRICAHVFYKDSKYGFNQARNTLRKLTYNGDLIANTQDFGRELFYQLNKKTITKHDYYILNFYGEMNKIATRIEEFHLEQHWLGGKRRTDGLIVIGIDIEDEYYTRPLFIECDFTHKTDKNKYKELYEDKNIQEKYGVFPDVVQIAFNDKPTIESNGEFKVIGVDYSFTNLASKILVG